MPPTRPLRPINPINACTLCLTAAAGTELAGTSYLVSQNYFIIQNNPSFLTKVLYNPKAFFTHAVLLDQGFPHCPIFHTAASRRSLGRISIPVWLFFLSKQL